MQNLYYGELKKKLLKVHRHQYIKLDYTVNTILPGLGSGTGDFAYVQVQVQVRVFTEYLGTGKCQQVRDR